MNKLSPAICLRAFRHSHLESLATWLRQPHVACWYPDPDDHLASAANPPAGGAQAIIASGASDVGYLRWQQVDRATLDALGLPEIPSNSIDVDILIGGDAYLGKGACSAALKALGIYAAIAGSRSTQ